MANTKVTGDLIASGTITAANLVSGTLDGILGTYLSTNAYATQSYVTTAVSNLIDAAPASLDTLNELAAALNDDANFATTVTNALATKLNLSGGNITGNLSVDTNVLFVDTVNDRVGIGTSSPFSLLHVGTRPGAGTTNPSLGSMLTVSNDGLTGIDLGGNVNANNVVGHINWVNYLGVGNYNTARIDAYADGAGNSGTLRFWTAAVSSTPSERMRITSAGNVGIGTTAPGAKLSLTNAQSTAANNTTTGSIFSATSAVHGLFIRNKGNSAGISGETFSTQLFTSSGTGDFEIYNSAANYSLVFGTNVTERMRIDASGNLLVGTTTNPSVSDAVVSHNGFFSSVVRGINTRMIYKGIRFSSTTGTEFIELNVGGIFSGSLTVYAQNAGSGGNRIITKAYMVTGITTIGFNADLVSETNGLVDSLTPTFTLTVPTSGVLRLTNTRSGAAALDYFMYFNGIGSSI